MHEGHMEKPYEFTDSVSLVILGQPSDLHSRPEAWTEVLRRRLEENKVIQVVVDKREFGMSQYSIAVAEELSKVLGEL